ncbi:MAG TPA: tetratricopeptide repeat protein, partial [Bacteroidales bacterium]|nr:tetratricopeptide repeat protein [Bacteroidales bacterium]
EKPGVYLDENNRRMFSNYRSTFGELALSLLAAGDTAKALEVTYKGLGLVPEDKMPYDYFALSLADALIECGRKDEGKEIINRILKYSGDYLGYCVAVPATERFGLEYTIGLNMQTYIDIYRMSRRLGLDDIATPLEQELNRFYSLLYPSNR